MNDAQISEIVARVLKRLDAEGAEHVMQTESTPRVNPGMQPASQGGEEGMIPDITRADLREQFLVDRPHDREGFMTLKRCTPARLGIGHAGSRHKTATMLRFQADHAAAQDAVFSDVDDAALQKMALPKFQTLCQSRDEFLTRPDRGRQFDEPTLKAIAQAAGTGMEVLLYVADGLSSTSVRANAADMLPVIRKGLEGYGIRVGNPFFVQYGRVGTMDVLSDALHPEVACVLLGERPGLVTAESMSAYLCYKPTVGMPESRRTVLANIHRGAAPPVEAAAHIVDLIRLMLEKKASGLDLPT